MAHDVENVKRYSVEHELKCWTPFFNDIRFGLKRFEVRRSDRDFRVGDTLLLRELIHGFNVFTGAVIRVRITYCLNGGAFGIEEGFVVLGIDPIDVAGKIENIDSSSAYGASIDLARDGCRTVFRKLDDGRISVTVYQGEDGLLHELTLSQSEADTLRGWMSARMHAPSQ